MIVIKVIAGVVGYIIISIAVTLLFVYADRKAGKPAYEVYEENNFEKYCMAGFLFPLSLPFITVAGIWKFIKIICVAIETKMKTVESEENKSC